MGRPEEAHAGALTVFAHVDDDARLEPMLRHIAGVALAQLGDVPGAREELEAAVAAARRCELPFELALGLDALEALGRFGVRTSPRRRRERDALLARLDILRLPAPPVVRWPESGP